MNGQAILVRMVEGRMVADVISHEADLIAALEVRGYALKGQATRRGLRPELQGAPTFEGLMGPCWGGDDHPLRYEDAEVSKILSQ